MSKLALRKRVKSGLKAGSISSDGMKEGNRSFRHRRAVDIALPNRKPYTACMLLMTTREVSASTSKTVRIHAQCQENNLNIRL